MDDNCVVFKGQRNGIAIHLNEHADYAAIKDVLARKTVKAKKFFEGAHANVVFKGRKLTESEERELLSIVSENSGMNVAFIKTPPKEMAYSPILRLPASYVSETRETYFHHGGLRSGQSIRFAGSVVVVGDVNPGGEVIAEGNIIVLGSLLGMVHAGCSGDKSCFISATRLEPTQIRIADIITYTPFTKLSKNNKGKIKLNPVFAYVENEQIYTMPLGH